MIIDTDDLRERVVDYFSEESKKEEGMSDSHAQKFLTRLETQQADQEKIIDQIEELFQKYEEKRPDWQRSLDKILEKKGVRV